MTSAEIAFIVLGAAVVILIHLALRPFASSRPRLLRPKWARQARRKLFLRWWRRYYRRRP